MASSSSLQLATFKQAVWDRLEDNQRFYPPDEIRRWCNDAIRTLNLFTGFLTGRATLIARARCHVYATPGTILVPTRVRFDGRDLQPMPFKDLQESNPRWLQETTGNNGQVANWSALGLHLSRKLILHPAPANGGAIVEVYGVREPAPLVNDTDSITLPTEYADILYALAAHIAMMKCGGMVARDAMIQYQQFLKRMSSLKRFQTKVNPRFFVEAEQRGND